MFCSDGIVDMLLLSQFTQYVETFVEQFDIECFHVRDLCTRLVQNGSVVTYIKFECSCCQLLCFECILIYIATQHGYQRYIYVLSNFVLL